MYLNISWFRINHENYIDRKKLRCYNHVQSFLLFFQVLSVDAFSAVPLSWWAHSVGWNEKAAWLWEVMATKSMRHRNSRLQLVEIDKNWWKHVKTTGFSTKNPWCQSWRVWVFLVMLTTFFLWNSRLQLGILGFQCLKYRDPHTGTYHCCHVQDGFADFHGCHRCEGSSISSHFRGWMMTWSQVMSLKTLFFWI